MGEASYAGGAQIAHTSVRYELCVCGGASPFSRVRVADSEHVTALAGSAPGLQGGIDQNHHMQWIVHVHSYLCQVANWPLTETPLPSDTDDTAPILTTRVPPM